VLLTAYPLISLFSFYLTPWV